MRGTLVSAVAAAAAMTLAAAAGAAPPVPAAGAGNTDPPVVTSSRTAGGNTILEGSQTGTITGTLDGSFVFTFSEVVHKDGSTVAHAHGVFTGTTACGAGTVLFEFNGNGDATTTFGHVVTTQQSGNTAGIHLQLDTVASPVGPFTYTGTYHCG